MTRESKTSQTLTDRKVQRRKVAKVQERLAAVTCDGNELENVFSFKYLGSLFTADGDHSRDVEKRCAMTMTRCGDLRSVFNSDIPLRLNLKIYKTAVYSLLTYGSEVWSLDKKKLSMLNGCNARCLSHIKHQSQRMQKFRQ